MPRLHPIVLALTLCPAAASADARPSLDERWEATEAIVDLQLGVNAPLGALGVSLELDPLPWIVTGVGLGVSFNGPQLAGYGRPRVRLTEGVTLGADLGLSIGDYSDCFFDCEYGHHWSSALWLNAGLSAEFFWTGSAHARLFAGRAFMLNPGSGELGSEAGRAFDLMFGGIAFGGAL